MYCTWRQRQAFLETEDGDIEREMGAQKGRLGPMTSLALIFIQATIFFLTNRPHKDGASFY